MIEVFFRKKKNISRLEKMKGKNKKSFSNCYLKSCPAKTINLTIRRFDKKSALQNLQKQLISYIFEGLNIV